MKTLILTSAGLSNQDIKGAFLGLLKKPISEIKVLIVAYAQNSEEEFYVNQTKVELESLGAVHINIANMHYDINIGELEIFDKIPNTKPDAIYVCGGNTFAILNKLRETGLDNYVVEQVSAQTSTDCIYIGVSAGSIIAGPSIEIAGWGSEADENKIGLADLTGFGLTNISIFPHYHDELKAEVDEFKSKVSYEVVELTNDQAVVIRGEEVELIN